MPNLTAESLRDTIATYKKYGWNLRRLLLTNSSKAAATSTGVTVENSDIDAAWFSRPPTDNAIAWELRYLGEVQYALIEHLNENDADFNDKLHEVEDRLRQALLKRSNA